MKIIRNEKLTSHIFVLTILDKKIATTAKPGQFVSIRVTRDIKYGQRYFPLLRRPLSVHSVEGDTFKLLYKVVGEGTHILSTYEPGEELDIIGPFGNPFINLDYKNILIVAGGMGVAPLYFLATQSRPYNSITTLIGAKTKNEVLCEGEFSKFGKVIVTTEDGSYGTKGVVTDLIATKLDEAKASGYQIEIIFACGPSGMLSVIKSYAASHSIPCQVSLERHLACGIGVCLGCAVAVKGGYKYVCKDGSVFWADEIIG